MKFDPTVVRDALHPLTEDYFLKDGVLWEVIDMGGRGSDVKQPVPVGKVSWAQRGLIIAALELQDRMKDLCKTGEPHRMRVVPAHEECVDCGKRG